MINNDAAVELVHVVNPSGGSGESYTAGTGITISDQNEIGIDQSVVATKAYVTQEVGTVREVPETSASDSGKVLGVTDSEGTLGWITNGGGSSYTAGTGIDITNDTISVDTSVIATKSDIPTKGSLMVKNGTTQKELYDAWAAGWTIQSNHGNEINVYELTKFDYDFGEYTATFSLITFSETTVSETSFVISGIASSTSAVSFGATTRKRTNQVPDASSQTVGKVLTIKSVPDEDPIASWETPSGGTQYSAGNGINISAQNEISVDTSVVATQNDLSGIEQVPTVTSTDDGKVLTASYSGGTGSFAWTTPSGGSSNVFVWEAGTTTNQEVYDAIAAGKDIFIHAVESGDNVVYQVYKYILISGTYYVYSSRYSDLGGTGNTGCVVQCVAYVTQNNNVANYKGQMNVSYITDKTDTYDSTSKKAMSGIAVASAISGVTLASLNTAGITDIQQVASLPANPVSTVLYLIPEN